MCLARRYNPNFHLISILRSRLHAGNTEQCPCGAGSQTAEHLMLFCPLCEPLRKGMCPVTSLPVSWWYQRLWLPSVVVSETVATVCGGIRDCGYCLWYQTVATVCGIRDCGYCLWYQRLWLLSVVSEIVATVCGGIHCRDVTSVSQTNTHTQTHKWSESYLGRLKRVFCGEVDVQEKDPAFIH